MDFPHFRVPMPQKMAKKQNLDRMQNKHMSKEQKAAYEELKENAKKHRMQQSKVRNNTLRNYASRKQALAREGARSFR